MEGDRFERQNGFAGLVDGPDLLLESARRDKGADFVIGIDVNWPGRGDRRVNVTDPSGVALVTDSHNIVTDTDIVIAGGKITAGIEAQPDVV